MGTGAGKHYLRERDGSPLGARGDVALIGVAADEVYVEAEFDAVDDDVLVICSKLRRTGEDGLRAGGADSSTGGRARTPGRVRSRGMLARAAEALIAMSGSVRASAASPQPLTSWAPM